MDPDTSLVTGLALLALALPAVMSAFADGRTPRVATITLVMAGGLLVYAINTKQGGYTLAEIPRTVYAVIADIIR